MDKILSTVTLRDYTFVHLHKTPTYTHISTGVVWLVTVTML